MIRYFASHPTAANLLMIAFVVVGLYSFPNVKRETFPDIPPDEVRVRVAYPGASATEVESAICERIEDAIDGVNNVSEIRCEAREGLGTATVLMEDGADFNNFHNDIKNEAEAIGTWPLQVETPVVTQLGRTDFVVAIAVTGPMSPPDLKAYAEQLKDKLLRVPEISQVVVKGFSDHQIRIEIPALTLRQYGLSVSGIADVIGRQSVNLPAGVIESSSQEVLIRFMDERRSAEAFRDLIVVSGESGAEILLGDIAAITDRFELDEDKIVFNGRRAAILEIIKTRSEDTLVVVDAVKRFIGEERRTAPRGVEFRLTKNVSSIVRDRLGMLVRNGVKGLVLVFLTMWLFFSFRFSFWVAMGLPISLFGTIFVMSMFGISFDMISIVGLLIAVGLLMDDAIVLSENIATHMSKGKSAVEAAIDGTRQVSPGVLASFVTTVFVFGSLMFLKGHIGAILRVLPIVLIVTLSVSLLEAFFILPHHLAHSRPGGGSREPSGFRRRFEAFLEQLRENVVGRTVDMAVEWRYLTLGGVICLFLLSLSVIAAGGLKFLAFPDIDGNVIEARILLPQGTPLKRTEAVVGRIGEALERVNTAFAPRQPAGKPLVRNVNVQYGFNRDAHESGPHVATVSADLLDAEIRDGPLDEIVGLWRQEAGALADVIAVNFVEFRHGPAGRAIDIRLRGDGLDELKEVSLELQGWLKTYKGVLDLTDDLRPGKPEIRLRLHEGAMALGLDAAGIADQLRSAFFGKTANEIQVGSESLEIDIRLAGADRDSLADLEYFTVTAADGQQVPLGTVAEIEKGRGYSRIARINGSRMVTIQGEVDMEIANAAEIIRDTKTRFLDSLFKRHPSISVTYEGQVKEGGTTGMSVVQGFMLGLVGVFLLLSFLFSSYAEPVVVMTAIPLGLIGVIWGHLLMGLDLSMPSMVGFASLAGIVINDSILLIYFIRIQRRQGRDAVEAAKLASRQRFRAVLLTSLTTVAGLSPLLAEGSLQAQVLKPLVTSLAFGLVASTLLVLFVVPVIYAILDDFGLIGKVENESPAGAAAPTSAAE